ncbi:MAG: hypothetical protein ACRC2B_11100 [Rubrivivax sp.]
MTSNVPSGATTNAAGECIARVLRAEHDARQSIEQAQVEAQRIAEAARASARDVAERTERRIRAVVEAFETGLATRLAEIDAEATRMATPHVLSDAELDALDCAVRALATEVTGAPP